MSNDPKLPDMATLLIVDDQPINVRALAQAFLADHRVLMATSGADAIRICRAHLPDLVLLDVEMPELGGHEVCRQLKADPRTSDIPVIFVTAQDEPSQEMLGLDLGAVDFIGKPVNPAVVRARVRTHLELRRAARELLALNESLESRIRDRTRALEAAMHAADAANRAKSDFLSNISHEIRTPINGVIGMTYLALRAEPPAPQRAYLEKIRGCGEHLLKIVNDVLDFSRIEAGRLELEDIEFELQALVDGVAAQTSCAAEAKGLALVFDIEPALVGPFGRCHGDSLRIAQVLLNFVGNAVKFSTRGTVRVLARREPDAGPEQVRFEVRDQGIGVAAHQLGELFRPFHQGDTSTTRQYGGSGLGLAICKQLATLMGGSVGVESEAGVGSTFWLSLPLRRASLAAPAQAQAPAPAPAQAQAQAQAQVQVQVPVMAGASRGVLEGARILVVEDNLINRALAIGLLEVVGAVVHVAVNGRQAVEQALGQPYDIILMDIQMPVMDGLEATRLLRLDGRTRATPVIAVTANASDEDRRRCMEAGMDDIVTKPIEPALLYALLSATLDRREAIAEAHALP